MKLTDDILRRIEKGEATEQEMKVAEDYLQGLSQRLSSQVDEWSAAETPSTKRPLRVWLHRAVAAAACILLFFAASMWYEHSLAPTMVAETQKDTFDNPDEAAREAEKALLKFSEAINKATCYNQTTKRNR